MSATTLEASLKEYLQSAGTNKIVVGLSGGIDSAVAAAIAVHAVGAENVQAFFMPYKTSNPISKTIAEEVANNLSINLQTIDISEVVDTFCKIDSDITPLRKGNVMARVRMTTLFDMSQKLGALVAGTSNKTECLLGYGTWYGDTASSVNLLGTLYKQQVYALANHYGLPKSVIERAPSADLWEGQTDEQEMGLTYADVDSLLMDIFEHKLSAAEVAGKYDREFIEKVAQKVEFSAFKRHTAYVCGTEKAQDVYAEIIKNY